MLESSGKCKPSALVSSLNLSEKKGVFSLLSCPPCLGNHDPDKRLGAVGRGMWRIVQTEERGQIEVEEGGGEEERRGWPEGAEWRFLEL